MKYFILVCRVMDEVNNEEVTIIDKDVTSNTVCHVVDGFLLEESNEPFPVRLTVFTRLVGKPLIDYSLCVVSYCLDIPDNVNLSCVP